jgi:hypothetical protein
VAAAQSVWFACVLKAKLFFFVIKENKRGEKWFGLIWPRLEACVGFFLTNPLDYWELRNFLNAPAQTPAKVCAVCSSFIGLYALSWEMRQHVSETVLASTWGHAVAQWSRPYRISRKGRGLETRWREWFLLIYLISSGLLNLQQKWIPEKEIKKFLEGRKWRAPQADNLTAICEPNVWTTWHPQYLPSI